MPGCGRLPPLTTAAFPDTCLWRADQVLDDEFWPERVEKEQ